MIQSVISERRESLNIGLKFEYTHPITNSIFQGLFLLTYRKTFDISCTKFPNLDISGSVLQLYSPNPLKPCVKSRMEM